MGNTWLLAMKLGRFWFWIFLIYILSRNLYHIVSLTTNGGSYTFLTDVYGYYIGRGVNKMQTNCHLFQSESKDMKMRGWSPHSQPNLSQFNG